VKGACWTRFRMGSSGVYEPGPGIFEAELSLNLATVPKEKLGCLARWWSAGMYFPGPGDSSIFLASSRGPKVYFAE